MVFQKQICAAQTGMSALPPKEDTTILILSASPVGGLSEIRAGVSVRRRWQRRLSASRASQFEQNRQLVLAHVSRIESRIALRGNYTLGGSHASENIALTRSGGLAMLQCVCLTTAHNIVRQSNASCGNFSLALLEALAQIVREHWHTAALFLKLFTAGQCNSSRLSNIEVHGN
ncbi:MAG: hypothetical protein WAL36_03535 [Pseudolabrys sp.]